MSSKIIWLFLCYYVGYSHCCHLKLYKQEDLKGPHHIQTIGEYGDEIKSLKNVGLCAWMVYRYVIVFIELQPQISQMNMLLFTICDLLGSN